MAAKTDPVTIKKYANRRLYNTGSSTYVTLEDLAEMIRRGEDFVVRDAKSGEDITRTVLTQIIVEQEGKGTHLLHTNFLRELIRLYGDSMQAFVPTYLDFSLDALKRERGRFQAPFGQTFGDPLAVIEGQVRRNMDMFEQAMKMFLPSERPAPRAATNGRDGDKPARDDSAGSSELDRLKRQLDSMKAQLDKLSGL